MLPPLERPSSHRVGWKLKAGFQQMVRVAPWVIEEEKKVAEVEFGGIPEVQISWY